MSMNSSRKWDGYLFSVKCHFHTETVAVKERSEVARAEPFR